MGWLKPEKNQRLFDHISISAFPAELMDQVIDGGAAQRDAPAPAAARVVVNYVLGLALLADSSYEEVMRNLVEGLSCTSSRTRDSQVPAEGPLAKPRARRGPEPLVALFGAVARPIATVESPGVLAATAGRPSRAPK